MKGNRDIKKEEMLTMILGDDCEEHCDLYFDCFALKNKIIRPEGSKFANHITYRCPFVVAPSYMSHAKHKNKEDR